MSVEDLRLLNAALTGHENWLRPAEVRRLHDLKRQVEIGWRLSVDQREEVGRLVTTSRERRHAQLPMRDRASRSLALGTRVLLMVSDLGQHERLAVVVRDRGLEAVSASGSDLLAVLGKEAPDAVVLDLALPGMHGGASLLELRDDRLHTGLPVLVLTNPALNEKEREIVQDMATLHSGSSDAEAVLATLLDAWFPLAGPRSGDG